MDRQLKLTDSAIIDLLGGTNKVAKLCKVAPTAVTQWRKNGIPADRFMFLGARIEQESHGLVSRKDLFPNNYFLIWPELLKNNAFGLQDDLDEE
jgi:DNA-binding transcriptional regulator YdaS (Cro superfamily)